MDTDSMGQRASKLGITSSECSAGFGSDEKHSKRSGTNEQSNWYLFVLVKFYWSA